MSLQIRDMMFRTAFVRTLLMLDREEHVEAMDTVLSKLKSTDSLLFRVP